MPPEEGQSSNFKVLYSFCHVNQFPHLADEYRVYRQDGDGPFVQVDTIVAEEVSIDDVPIQITGLDIVPDCGVIYNYKVSAFNTRGEIDCINPTFSGIDFICPTPSPTPSVTITPTSTVTPSISVTPTATQSITPTNTVTPTTTKTPAASQSPTPTVTSTPSITPTNTVTPTTTKTPAASQSPTPTVTSTPSITPTNTVTPTATKTPPASKTPTPTVTSTPSITPTNTVTPTTTASITPTNTVTPTATKTPPASKTPTPTVTSTPSITPTNTVTPTVTQTPSPSPQLPEGPQTEQITISSADLTSMGNGFYRSNLSWKAGATSVEIVPQENGGSWNSTWTDFTSTFVGFVQGSSTPQRSTRSEFGGFAELKDRFDPTESQTAPEWAEMDSTDGFPISANSSMIPDSFTEPSTRSFGLYDFGLFQCQNVSCSDPSTSHRATITNPKVLKVVDHGTTVVPIGFFVNILQDQPTKLLVTSDSSKRADPPQLIGSENISIGLTLRWHFD